jgi:hypothetical protein
MPSDDGEGAAGVAQCSSLILSHKNSAQVEALARRMPALSPTVLRRVSSR